MSTVPYRLPNHSMNMTHLRAPASVDANKPATPMTAAPMSSDAI